MKLLNFAAEGRQSFGVLSGAGVIDLGRIHARFTDVIDFLRGDMLASVRTIGESQRSDYALEDVEVLKPVGRSSRYFCIGVNYPERNEEYRDGSQRPQYPSIFMRTDASFSGPGQPIVRPAESEQFDYEGEIVVVLGSGGRRIPQDEAMQHIAAYSCANDGSVRDWLRHSKFNVTQGKNFDRSGAIGPWLVTPDELGGESLRVSTRVNGELRQDDTSDRMLFPIRYLIHYLSTFCALEPGDVILTGTPSGAGARLDPPQYLRAGDLVEVEVAGVGLLRNEVIDDEVKA